MLYRFTALKGYAIVAADGEIGWLEDVYFDDERPVLVIPTPPMWRNWTHPRISPAV